MTLFPELKTKMRFETFVHSGVYINIINCTEKDYYIVKKNELSSIDVKEINK